VPWIESSQPGHPFLPGFALGVDEQQLAGQQPDGAGLGLGQVGRGGEVVFGQRPGHPAGEPLQTFSYTSPSTLAIPVTDKRRYGALRQIYSRKRLHLTCDTIGD
jgi:hypothetical protein